MKATGIVRRIDDLGRIVIPKEIRRSFRIKEGDPLEIFTNADGEVMAVLGVDAKLGYSDFAQYGPINFERLTSISALLFLLSLVLFVLCMDKGLSEEEKENRWRRRHGLPPKPTKKDNIVVDTLDDIDPNDYL